MSRRKITATHIRHCQQAVAEYLGLLLTAEQAQRVLEADRSLLPELSNDGNLDTAPRDYLAMAFIEVFMPGAATEKDPLVDGRHDGWHWPCNGSGTCYAIEFYRTLELAILANHIGVVRPIHLALNLL